ncbi:MAG: transcriptional repressor LexA [Candidatus Saccharibacteria bacterium]
MKLTSKQSQVLNFVQDYKNVNGCSPTLKSIAESLNLKSLSTVHQHLKALIDKGFLNQEDSYGNITIPSDESHTKQVPILGYIAGGLPIEAVEDSTPEFITVYNTTIEGDFYALRVSGESMIDDGIFNGDIVIIKRQRSAENGQTVVAIVDDEYTTLKKLYRTKSGFELRPANQTILPIFRKEIEIRGVVWEVRRNYNLSTPHINPVKKWRTLDLFAGVGGIRIGFENAGFKTVFSNDFEKNCKNTYDLNFKDSKLIVEDITKIRTEDLPEFDFVLGGFPCQAFSIAGYRHGFDDQKGRGNLFLDVARIIKDKQPTGFLLENVKNLKSHDGGRTFSIIEQTLTDLGYTLKSKVLNSMEYGNVPQNRERIYIVGFKDPLKTEAFDFPDKIPLTKSILDLLDKDVPEKYYYNGKPLYDKLKNDVNEQGAVYQWRRKYVRKNKKGVCPTLTANMGMGGHNVPIIYDGKGIRKLTPRECARIQGFPDSYLLPDVADSILYKQFGNSVSMPVLQRIAEKMQKVL